MCYRFVSFVRAQAKYRVYPRPRDGNTKHNKKTKAKKVQWCPSKCTRTAHSATVAPSIRRLVHVHRAVRPRVAERAHDGRHVVEVQVAGRRLDVRAPDLRRLLRALLVRVAVLLQAAHAVHDLGAAEAREERPRLDDADMHDGRVQPLHRART